MPTIIRRGDRWQAKVRRKGYPPQSETFRTKGLAEKWARDVEAQIDAGKFAPAPREARATTLDEALARYLRDVTPKKKTPRPEEIKIAALRRHPIASRHLAAIRGADVAALRDELAQRLAPSTVRLYLAILSHLYNVARREWRFEGLANPVDEVTKPSVVGRARRRRAEGDELAKILAAAKKVGPAWAPAAIELAVESAMRRGELAAMRWAWVDLGARLVRLPETKNNEARDVPLSRRAIAILKAIPRDGDLVFGVHPDTISHAFADACAEAGVEGLRLHDLRREATSRLFERGDFSIVEVAAVTGHKTLQMLKTYTAPRPSDLARKLAKKKARPE